MKIYTHNLGLDHDDPERRLQDFSERALAARPDIMFLQEVSHRIGYYALQGLVRSLGADYGLRYETTYPDAKNELGLAVISKLPIRGSVMTSYGDSGNESQIVELGTKRGSIIGVNVHHEASPLHEGARMRKNRELATRLKTEYQDSGHILAGSFNAWPHFPSIHSLRRQKFQSAFKAVNGYHDSTYPTMGLGYLLDRKYVEQEDVSKLQRFSYATNLLHNENYEIPSYAIDYIFLRNMGKPLNARLIRSWKDVPAESLSVVSDQRESTTAYPISDHYGVEVDVAE